MWGYLEFRQMELYMILLMRRLNIKEQGKIRYDGQFIWVIK